MEQRADPHGRTRLGREQQNGNVSPRTRRKLTKRELAFAEEGLDEMHRLINECSRLTVRRDELEPRFKEACMQKAWVVLMSYLLGLLLLLFSILWTGIGIVLARVALVAILAGLYFAPVHWFTSGQLRADTRLVRELDKKSLANAKQAAGIGKSMTRQFHKLFGQNRSPPPR